VLLLRSKDQEYNNPLESFATCYIAFSLFG